MENNEPATSPFIWRAHPAAERRGAAFAASLLVLAVAAAVGLGFGPAWATLSVVVLVASLSRFFFPSRFSIDADGITARFPLGTKRLRWDEARRFVVDDRGGFLSTRARRSWLDAYRGVHVLFGRSRGQVVDLIRSRLPQCRAERGGGAWD